MSTKTKAQEHGGARKGAGRPPHPEDLVQMTTHVPAEMKRRLIQEAKDGGISLSERVRQVVVHYWLMIPGGDT